MEKTKFKTGTKDLPKEWFDPENVRVRTSIVFEGDLMNALKASAKAAGVPYQVHAKDILRQHLGLAENPKTDPSKELMSRGEVEKMFQKYGLKPKKRA